MNAGNKQEVIEKLNLSLEKILTFMPASYIPDAGMNLAYAISDARTPSEIAAIEGGILRTTNKVHPSGEIKFGADIKIAKIVLTAMKFDQEIRSAANIRFSKEIIKKAEDLLLEIRCFDSKTVPPGVSTMDWGVAFCCEEEDVPDLIYDCGTSGNDSEIKILGVDPQTVVNNIIMIAERINNKTNR